MLENFFKKEKQLEQKELPRLDTVVVLGGDMEKDENGNDVPGITSKMRLIAAQELYKRDLVKKIILTGGIFQKGQNKPQADAMKEFLAAQGVSEQDMLLENTSRNTSENLFNVLEILKREAINKVLLETNEYHLERAKQIFSNILEEAGLKIGYEEIKGLTIEGVDVESIAAEEILSERSPHYKKLIDAFTLPKSLILNPKEAVKLGVREFLRRVLIYIDRNDRLARFLVKYVRHP